MAFEHKLYGRMAAWGVGVTPLPDDSVFVASHQLSFNSANYEQKDKMGNTVGLRITGVDIPFTTSGELVGGEGNSVSLVLALGLVDSHTGTAWTDYARPHCSDAPGNEYKAYVLNFDTSAGRDGVRQVSASGKYYGF